MKTYGNKSLFFLILFLTFTPGCASWFIKTSPPLAKKSTAYRFSFQPRFQKTWKPLLRTNKASFPKADIAYRSQKTGSILSFSSTCQTLSKPPSLKQLTNTLLSGLEEVSARKKKHYLIASSQALETQVLVNTQQQTLMIQTTVFRNHHCTYDIMHISAPDAFEKEQKDYETFLKAFHF